MRLLLISVVALGCAETKTATQTLELRGPQTLVFHDSNQEPAELARPHTLGLAFRVSPPPPPAREPDRD